MALLEPSGMTTALLGILVDGGGGLMLVIFGMTVLLGAAGLAGSAAGVGTGAAVFVAAGLLTTVFTFPICSKENKSFRKRNWQTKNKLN